MKVLDLLNQLLTLGASAGGDALKEILTNAIAAAPDLAPSLQPILDALDADLTPANIAALLAVLPAEAREIIQGHFNPRDHAGDSA